MIEDSELHFSSSLNASESLGLVAEWTLALSGNGELSDVLTRLMCLVNADTALLVRISKLDGRTNYIARSSVDTGKVWSTQPRSYTKSIVGDCLFAAKPGSLWKLSDVSSSELSARFGGYEDIPEDLVEAIVSPMEPASRHKDCLELHFQHRPAEHDLNLITMLIETFASNWGRRTPGTISKKLKQKRQISISLSDKDSCVPILDVENPAQLSRCEFRVCSLLKEGMTVNVIADTLSIGPATVRSHLSSIFSKTDVSSQVELLHRLNSTAQIVNNGDSTESLPLDKSQNL